MKNTRMRYQNLEGHPLVCVEKKRNAGLNGGLTVYPIRGYARLEVWLGVGRRTIHLGHNYADIFGQGSFPKSVQELLSQIWEGNTDLGKIRDLAIWDISDLEKWEEAELKRVRELYSESELLECDIEKVKNGCIRLKSFLEALINACDNPRKPAKPVKRLNPKQ